jgi:hypothetical protein
VKKFKGSIKRVAFEIQKIVLILSGFIFKVIYRKKRFSWVVGVHEIAGQLHFISKNLSRTASVCLQKNKFYNFKYDFEMPSAYNLFWKKILEIFYGPFLLGKLSNLSAGFFYIWSKKYLFSDFDEGKFELRFLKKRKIKIVSYFCGSDIRSPKLSNKLEKKLQVELASSYMQILYPEMRNPAYDKQIKKRAAVAEKYSDYIFSAPNDQISYFKKRPLPFMYFYPTDSLLKNKAKFKGSYIPRIFHSSSSPFTKGTQIVRSAITKLRSEGYKFQYVEKINVANKVIISELKQAHIVLNEFYALVPGIFGIEAMANYCALMTSADERLEQALPKNSNHAWFCTRPHQVYDHLKKLINSKNLQLKYADRGFKWLCENGSEKISGQKLQKIICNSL